MSLVPEVELKDILLSNSTFGPSEIVFISNRISNDFSQFPNLTEATQQLEMQTERSPATSVKLGVCQYLTGHYTDAIETLSNADGGALGVVLSRQKPLRVGRLRHRDPKLQLGPSRGLQRRPLPTRRCCLSASTKRHRRRDGDCR